MMKRSAMGVALAIVAAALLAACGAGISSQAKAKINYDGTFAQLQQHPDRYSGQVALLGGKIIESRVADGRTELVVLHLALDSWDKPKDEDSSQGRYLLQSRQFLDPAIYGQGALVTVVAQVRGNRVEPIGQMDYRYPLLDVVEIKKLPPRSQRSEPRIHFGIGVGKTF